MSRRSLRFTLLGCGLAGMVMAQDFIRVVHPEPLPASLAAAVDGLDHLHLERHLAFLTAPRQEGRGLGTRGLERTARYLQRQLEACGLPPLGPDYRQRVPLRATRPSGGRLHLEAGSHHLRFEAGQDLVLPPVEPGVLSLPWVFAGRAIREPGLGHDDFQGLEVRGRAVVFLGSLPEGATWRRPDLQERYASPRRADRYDSRLALLESLGARAAIALEDDLAARLAAGQETALPYVLAARGVSRQGEPPLIRLALRQGLRSLLESHRQGRVTLTTQGRVQPLVSVNVLARLDGSDPNLRGEAILLGAHMDHLGQPKGVLHPGADDNASGVSALLEIARVLATSPHRPKRTLLFAFWTGEEEGKFGSGHYTRHPRWSLGATKAYINLDMIGHPWTPADLQALAGDTRSPAPAGFLAGLDPRWFAEPGLSIGHPELGLALAQAGRGTGMSLHLDWTDGRNGGSDYRDFARLGVPILRFFGSYFPEYHRPGDTLEQLDTAQVHRMARLILATAWLLANR